VEFDVDLKGLDELKARMQQLSKTVQIKSVNFATRKAANVLRDIARENASRVNDPATKEEIAQNIVTAMSPRYFRQTGDTMARVGVLGGARAPSGSKQAAKTARRRTRLGQSSLADLGEIEGRGKGNPGGDTFYWRFLEFGTKRSRAQPFIRPAIENADHAVEAFSTELNKRLDAEIRKL